MIQSTKDLFTTIIQQEKAALDFGFYWESLDQLIDQIKSECEEIREAHSRGDKPHLQEEVGDLINAAISLCIFCQLDPHKTLNDSIEKFQKRYDSVVHLAKTQGYSTLRDQPFDVLMDFWNKAKQQVG